MRNGERRFARAEAREAGAGADGEEGGSRTKNLPTRSLRSRRQAVREGGATPALPSLPNMFLLLLRLPLLLTSPPPILPELFLRQRLLFFDDEGGVTARGTADLGTTSRAADGGARGSRAGNLKKLFLSTKRLYW